VDAADFPGISEWSWCTYRSSSGVWYAHANVALRDGNRQIIAMHSYLINPGSGFEVDHIDGNGLNNRRTNLRISTHQQNCRNGAPHRDGSSRFKGVAWYKRDACWRAYIVVDGRQLHLGYFDCETDAAVAYNAAATRLFGEFARLNAFTDIIDRHGEAAVEAQQIASSVKYVQGLFKF